MILQYVLIGANVVLVAILIWMVRKLSGQSALREQINEHNRSLEDRIGVLELDSIKYKLNPHLFKNTLNTIQSHAYQTYYALDKLANVLDYTLYESDEEFVPLAKEIDFATNLIDINRLKISPLFDLRVKNKIASQQDNKLIAPLVTAHLIENAFKHANLQSEDAFISINFDVRDKVFLLTVSNKISTQPTLKKENSGFGNGSFRKRMDILYKDNYSLECFVENDVYVSQLKVNLIEQKIKVHIAG